MESNKKELVIITFPKDEWIAIKKRFKENKTVYTIRVSNELGRYKKDMIVITEWNEHLKVISVKTIKNGIVGLKTEYEYFSELTDNMLSQLGKYDEIDVIKLEKCGNK